MKVPKLREARSINWRQTFIDIIDFVKDYAKRWAKFGKRRP